MKEKWKYKKLGEVCEIICGQDYKSIQDDNGMFPIYGTGGVMGRASQYRCPAYSIIIGRKGNINNPLFVEEPFWNVDTAFGVVPNASVLFPKFFYFFCKNYDFTKHDVSVTIPSLRRADIINIAVPIPPLSEQSRIVSELDLLQSIIDKQKAQLKELDNLAQAVFYDMFGDPVENDKGWEVKKLGDECTDMKYGTSRPSCENGKYSYLRMCNISSDGHLDLNNLKTIDVPDDEVEKCIVRYGDILFNRTNSIDLIGKTCMFDLKTPMIIAGYIIRVRLSENLESRFVSCMFNMPSMKKLLRAMAKGAVNQANINSKELASIIIPIPPVILQHSFAAKIDSIEKQKAAITQSIAETQRLFDYTMDKYFG